MISATAPYLLKKKTRADDIFTSLYLMFCWWLVELPMWLTDGFSVTFLGRWRGLCAYT